MSGSWAPRILVIDDHELNLKLLHRVLELEGHDVIAVGSLAAAEQAIEELDPALIVLDLNLPDGDGLDLARKLKGDPDAAAPAILACTAGVMRGEREHALEAGCDAYVSKPIDTRRFAELVASLLPSEGSGTASWRSAS